jgi:cell surface protein SprA
LIITLSILGYFKKIKTGKVFGCGFLALIFIFMLSGVSNAQVTPKDTSKLKFPLTDNRLPYRTSNTAPGIQLKPPSNLYKTIEYDPVTNQYVFKEKIGNYDYSMPYSMDLKEYQQYENKRVVRQNWDDKAKAEQRAGGKTGSNLNIGIEALDKIFGTNTITITPQGSAELIFGINTNKTDNPAISERLRKTTTFDFQEKIQMNVTGSIGDKLKLGVNYNTEATFDFENKTKLEYTGKEDEIIRKIEAGNVTLPLTGSLITGSQSLFGLKTELQFGKLTVTSVFSQQKGESSVIEVKGGAQVSEFETTIDEYDEGKHYFLSQFFRNHYETALKDLPVINSGITITKIEVWVTNATKTVTDVRDVLAFMDLGETRPYNTVPNFRFKQFLGSGEYAEIPSNDVNYLYENVAGDGNNRTLHTNTLNNYQTYGFVNGRDYVDLGGAKMLSDRDYTLHPTLGYISLNIKLDPTQCLAVAYEYTFGGRTYKVGELSTSGIAAPQALFVKLLKSKDASPKLPTWDLMMKNVYAINAYQINKENFFLSILYQDDKNGTPLNYLSEIKEKSKDDILLNVMGLDHVNTQHDPYPDGVFDFIEGYTIYASNGRIFFPTLEPFGETLKKYLVEKKGFPAESSIVKKYVFSELYDSTQTKAKQIAEKNKFLLKGTYQSAISSDIALNALNVPQGSVVVTAGGRKLIENQDYTVDYTLGRVKIINSGLLESGTPIKISLESNSLFNFQTKTMVGTHLDYKFSDNFNLGATIINLTERPLTQKVNIGDEPISNTIWGLNGTYTTKSQFLTNLVDKIPFIQTKEPSSITVDGEFAQLIPGHSKAVSKSGTAFIDDFEGSETPIDMRQYSSWYIASTPQDQSMFPEAYSNFSLDYGKGRAKMAWYSIDPIFTRTYSSTPGHIRNDKESRSSHFVREVYETEIFKNKDNPTDMPGNIPILNVAYYPKERGPYNYDVQNVDSVGTFRNPEERWAGIQREVLTNDFEAANVEFIEFWLMDPFCEDESNTHKGGDLYFNLGDISEDVLKDGRKSFEDGLPKDGDRSKVDSTAWGYISKDQSIVDAFDANRANRDVGLDGMKNDYEKAYFSDFINSLLQIPGINTDAKAVQDVLNDPSSDDFTYYRNDQYDQEQVGILGRYKKYNGLENNSPAVESNTEYTASNSNLPNTEDINDDNTLDQYENYYQYHVQLRRDKLKVGTNFVVDSVVGTEVEFPNGEKSSVTWYQFRIPINSYEKIVGTKEDFTSIQFMRMFLKGFSDSVILRFARLELVRGEWRKYNLSLWSGGESNSTPDQKDASFEITSVNIEENADKSPVNYVLPPGVTRQIDPQNPQLLELNEQSMVLKVRDLNNGDARAAYKNIGLDVRQYRRLQMEVHAEELPGTTLKDNELTLFIRLGSDYKGNFYEYEIPLKVTPGGKKYSNDDNNDRLIVWPDSNRIDVAMEDFQRVKQARNDEMRRVGSNVVSSTIFEYFIEGRRGKFSIRGNPNLSNVRTIMVGVRYPYNENTYGQSRSVEVWVNELRLTDFNEKGGWAANMRVVSKLADFATISVSGNTSKPGFGSIEKKVNERSKEDVYQYDIASNIELGKFFPEKAGVQIPMYVGFSETMINPEFNPLDPDIELKAALKNAKTKGERDSIKHRSQDYTQRKSLNFTNVRINKMEGKPHIYDISNLTFNYAYNETYTRNINIEKSIQKRYTGGLIYNYSLEPKNITPFQKLKFLRGNAFRLVRDFNFNYLPSNLSFRTDITRNYSQTKTRNVNFIDDPLFEMEPTVNKDFLWNRYYEMNFDLTRSLKLDFTASNVARIDEPYGIVDRGVRDEYQHWKDSVWNSIKDGGRTTHYQHDIRLTYSVPINKLPYMEWTTANLNYSTTYDWNAAPIVTDPNLEVGNTIANSGTFNASGQLNFVTLYNKVPYFRKVSQPQARRPNQQQKRTKKVTYEKDRTFLDANQPKNITHNLGTQDVTIKVYDAENKEIQGKTSVVNENKVTFTTDKEYQRVRIVVEGNVELKPSIFKLIAENTTRFVLGVKNVSISWSRMQGSTVPGFLPNSRVLGMSRISNTLAPGWDYILGLQDDNFGQRAVDNNWLTNSSYLNEPFVNTLNDNVTVRSSVEPIAGFKIEVTGNWNYSKNSNRYFNPNKWDMNESSFTDPLSSGNYSISFIAIGSAFQKIDIDNDWESPVYRKFERNLPIIARRRGAEYQAKVNDYNAAHSDGIAYEMYPDPTNLDNVNGFGIESQEVLIPAFMAAYGDIDPGKVTLDKFPSIFHMLPNWRLNYDGLAKIPFVQKYARSVSVTHMYRCTYNVGNYISNPDYMVDIQETLNTYRDLNNNFVPQYDISSVSITEQFGPLVGLDITFKNSLSTRIDVKKNRNIMLSTSNSQITENVSSEFVVGAGYKISDFKLTIRNTATGQKPYSSDLNLRADFSIRDNKMVIRRRSNDNGQAAQGQNILTLKLSADYMLSDKFNLRVFYDKTVNKPYISSQFPRSDTQFGFSLRFSLTQ